MELVNLGLRRLLCPLVAVLAVVPAIPARADGDTVSPRSTFATPNGSVVVRSPVSNGRVEGESTDEQAVQGVLIRYCNQLFCQYRFEHSPAPQQRHHWTFDVPPDGTWQVNVRAVDLEGNMEQPGPEITIAVLPIELPRVPVDVPVDGVLPLPAPPELPPLPPIPVPH